ncbi:Monocarboxylate transporter 2 [Myotis brandtii]|uniref:Monocarboxylate transporter 2 n=1 Tax=Myotis brandtii TaxID=109478 RepID=S7NE77_MYOBR|nr:Monocarboxylate transporter 2 [Myotis brandtii]
MLTACKHSKGGGSISRFCSSTRSSEPSCKEPATKEQRAERQRKTYKYVSRIQCVKIHLLWSWMSSSPISSILVNKYGSRPVVMLGGLLCCVGLVAASFSTSVIELYVTVGFIGGLGLAFNLQPALTIIGKYFYKKRPMANGLAMAGSPVFLRFFAPVIFLAPYAKDKGIDEYSAAFLLSVMAFVDMFARPAVGFIANTKLVRPRIQYFFSFAIMFTGVCHLLCPLAEDYISLVFYAIFFGLGFGSVSSILFESLMDLVGAQRFSSAVGLVTIVECCPVLLGPPLAGKLVDETGEYKYMYIACGAVVFLASVWLLIGNTINYRLLAKEKKLEKAKEETNNKPESRESEPLNASKQCDVEVKSTRPGSNPSERETNI